MDAVLVMWRSRLHRRGRAWLVLAVILGVGSGAGLACLAGARRTTSAFGRIAVVTGYPDVVSSHGLPPDEALAVNEGLAGVVDHSVQVGFVGFVEDRDPTLFKFFIGSFDRPLVHNLPLLRAGRHPDPDRPEEVLLTGRAVDLAAVEPGDELSLNLFSTDGEETVAHRAVVTGTAADSIEVAADASQDRSAVYLTPAFTRANAARLQAWSSSRLILDPSASVDGDLVPQFRDVGWSVDETLAAAETRVQEAIRPLNATLALLGLLMVVATLAVVGQALARQSDGGRRESGAARAMGFTSGQVRLLEVSSVLAVGLPGVLVAVVVAVALSPLFPVGAVRALEPNRGFDVDFVVLGLGAAAVVGAVVVGDRLATRRWRRPGRPAAPPHAAAAVGAGRPALSTGLGLAFGATAEQRRRFWTTTTLSALSLSLVVGAIAFVSALDRLGEEPRRFGAGWDLTARNAYGEVPPGELRALVGGDVDIEGVSGAGVTPMLLDGRVRAPGLAVLGVTTELWPTVVDGTTPRGDGEILVGAEVLDALDADVGDTVELRSQFFSPEVSRQATISGTAVFPAVELAGADSTRLANGVAMTWATYQNFQPGAEEGDRLPDFADRLPDFTFFDLADGVDPQVIIDRYRDGLPDLSGFGQTEWLPSLAPAEVLESDRAIGLIWSFVVLLGLTVVAAVGHAVVSAVRQGRRDYGVLKVLGFTRGQVVGAVMCQSLAVVVLALVAALPLGTALGRWSWQTFADVIGVLDTPVIPLTALSSVTAVAMFAAVVVAIGPALSAGRTRPAVALRQE